MRMRVLLVVSGTLNLLLAFVLFAPRHITAPRIHMATQTVDGSGPAVLLRTNTVVRRENFTWDQVEKERRDLLTELLGPNWDTSKASQLAAFNFYLDGPVLGKLPPETKEAVHEIETRGTQQREAYIAKARADGKEPDPRELARLRQQMRAELAKILNPEQLEEYLLRYSQNAQNLREETRGLGISAEEFRKIFRARDEID